MAKLGLKARLYKLYSQALLSCFLAAVAPVSQFLGRGGGVCAGGGGDL